MKKINQIYGLFFLVLISSLLMGVYSRLIFGVFGQHQLLLAEGGRAFFRGLLFDFSVAAFAFIPFLFLVLIPEKIRRWPLFSKYVFFKFYLITGVLAFATFSELFFIQEFNARFNFIAVDYLVYTNEVIRNIWESYPVAIILPVFLLIHFVVSRALFQFIYSSFHKRIAKLGPFLFLLALCLPGLFWSESEILGGVSPFEGEFSKNSIYALFAAYRNNEISYDRFYQNMDRQLALHRIHEKFENDSEDLPGNSEGPEDEAAIARNIKNLGEEKRHNVVVILMESMSARFLNAYGSKNNITPNLDRLAEESLFFDHIYSTGTRTVRGIEATVLSIPPTPGQSIVRRPESEGLYNIGTVFRQRKYTTKFIYGGNAEFDNMGEFFSKNGFEVIDQTKFLSDDIHFSNAWGICDEDLFGIALKEADQSAQNPFFQFILTTSNHRPYTYPNGRIDIPSHSGRDGAVKYADFAIGDFIEKAKRKPWFKNTIFVIVADHNASVAGGTKVLPYDFRIPMMFYAPGIIRPQNISILGSQIDLAPTLFGLMNFSYQSRFWGQDLMHTSQRRAFLATYSSVGLMQNEKLILLEPKKKITVYKLNGEFPELVRNEISNSAELLTDNDITDTIAYYQSASNWFSSRQMKEAAHADARLNLRKF